MDANAAGRMYPDQSLSGGRLVLRSPQRVEPGALLLLVGQHRYRPQLPLRERGRLRREHLGLDRSRQPQQRHHLRDPRPGQPLPPRQRRPALDLPGIEQRLVPQRPLELRPPPVERVVSCGRDGRDQEM